MSLWQITGGALRSPLFTTSRRCSMKLSRKSPPATGTTLPKNFAPLSKHGMGSESRRHKRRNNVMVKNPSQARIRPPPNVDSCEYFRDDCKHQRPSLRVIHIASEQSIHIIGIGTICPLLEKLKNIAIELDVD